MASDLVGGCGQAGHGVGGKWCSLCCWTLMSENRCPYVEVRMGVNWASWCPFCGGGVSNEHEWSTE
jgi:hypothetical protein